MLAAQASRAQPLSSLRAAGAAAPPREPPRATASAMAAAAGSSPLAPAQFALALTGSLLLITAGCVANNVVLEVIVSTRANAHADPGAGGLLTFLQFLFVAACNVGEALVWRGGGGGGGGGGAGGKGKAAGKGGWALALRAPVVPLRHYVQMTLLFFSMSYLNNFVFQFNISQPLHMVFRSANLATTLLLGYFFFGQR